MPPLAPAIGSGSDETPPPSALNLVMLQYLSPLILRLENQLHHFTHGAFSTRRFRNVMRLALHFRPRISHRNRETHAMHDGDIGEIVADISHLASVYLGVRDYLFQNRNLL